MNTRFCLARLVVSALLPLAVTAVGLAQSAPLITSISAPRQVVNLNRTLTLSATATGSPAPTFQWRRNGRAIPGATGSSYTITNAHSIRDNGWYQLVASNSVGSTVSATVFVNVAVAPRIVTWGSDDFRERQVPDDVAKTRLVALAAGYNYSLALKADGTVTAWGRAEDNRLAVPGGLSSVVALSARITHSLALRSNGTVAAWGANINGETVVPAAATSVVAIAAGGGHSLALKADGTVVAWGSNSSGQSSVPTGLNNVIAIAAGGDFSMALKSDGTIFVWGSNAFNQQLVPAAAMSGIVDIAAGNFYAVVLRNNGTVVTWGSNFAGEAVVPAAATNLVRITAVYTTIGVKNDGTVIAWGGNGGQLQVPSSVTNVMDISTYYHGLALLPGIIPPGDTGVTAGTSATFNVITDGAPNLQWQRQPAGGNAFSNLANNTNYSGTTSDTLTVNTTIDMNGDRFRAVVTENGTSTTTNAAQLTVNPAPATIATPPVSQGVLVGATAVFSVVAAGTPPFTYAWQRSTNGGASWTALPNDPTYSGVTTATLTVRNVTAAMTGDRFRVRVENDVAAVFSDGAVLTIVAAVAPTFRTQPAAQAATFGGTVTLTADAAGTPVPVYQWFKDNTAVPGATGATLTLQNLAAAESGAYTVVATNSAGSVVSSAAVLTVSPAPGRLINLAILAQLTPADPVLIVGAVVGGTNTAANATKALLIRAAGPSLTRLGVTGVVSDPKLDLYQGQSTTPVLSNDNWGGSAALTTIFNQVGAFPYAAANSLDAAVYNSSLPRSDYGVHVTGSGAGTGTVIAELYDATPEAMYRATVPRLINVSVRKRIEPGNVLTAGFVIGGGTPRTVLIRAVGPTLGLPPFNLGGVMTDPRIQLFNQAQQVIGSNDNWGGGTALTAAFSAVGAFGLPTASLDAAVLVTLTPGEYTAQVSGVGGLGGVVIVEVYEAP